MLLLKDLTGLVGGGIEPESSEAALPTRSLIVLPESTSRPTHESGQDWSRSLGGGGVVNTSRIVRLFLLAARGELHHPPATRKPPRTVEASNLRTAIGKPADEPRDRQE